MDIKRIAELTDRMIQYEQGVPKRIHHFLKVYSFARTVGLKENIPEDVQEVLEVSAVVHDIGIRPSLEKYQSSAGTYQQIEGPAVAEEMLRELGFEEKFIERVCYLIAHHHSYSNIDGIDYQILVEADFLVNIFEDGMKQENIIHVRDTIFKTKTGREILEKMFL